MPCLFRPQEPDSQSSAIWGAPAFGDEAQSSSLPVSMAFCPAYVAEAALRTTADRSETGFRNETCSGRAPPTALALVKVL